MARKKAKKGSCLYVPNVPGTDEASEMFLKLDDLTKYRPVTTYLYGMYVHSNVPTLMDRRGYARNAQGQHKAEDVFRFLKGKEFIDTSVFKIKKVAEANGFMSGDNFVDFKDGKVALQKAKAFNDSSIGHVAYVVKNGDNYNVILDNRNSRTLQRKIDTDKALLQWQTLESYLTSRGIDTASLTQYISNIYNPTNIQNFVQNIRALSFVDNKILSKEDILALLLINPNSRYVQSVMSRGWGNYEETATKIFDYLNDPATPSGLNSFLDNLLTDTKQLKDVDRVKLIDELNNAVLSFEISDDTVSLQDVINDLNKKYTLDPTIVIRKVKEIEKISDAVADAVVSLERQIRTIEREKGPTQQTETLKGIKDKLMLELEKAQYAGGLVDFIKTGYNYLTRVNTILDSISQTGTDLEYAIRIADAVSTASSLFDSYYPIVKALSNADALLNDLASSKIADLKSEARDIRDAFDNQNKKVIALRKEAMIAVGKNFLGESNLTYSKDLVNIINMGEADATLVDYLFAVGRISNPVASSMGAIIRDAQTERDKKLLDIRNQIAQANHKLFSSGHKDTLFMYDEDSGDIASPYDWKTFRKERAKEAAKLKKLGIYPGSLEFKLEMDAWEDTNMQEIEVDHINHRFEKVPVFMNIDFDAGWTQAQKEYYSTMMELKGQIGTLLPAYAQHQYLPPQRRTDFVELIKEGINGNKSFETVVRTILKNWNIFKLKKDDTRFYVNGLIHIDGDDYSSTYGAYDDTVLKQIPVFYINKVSKDELMHDFSGALQSLASTALNYNAMNRIKNIIEVMCDYVDDNSVSATVKGGKAAEVVNNEDVAILRRLSKEAKNSNLSTLMHAFAMKQIYGMEIRPAESEWQEKSRVILSNLIGYTSFKGLALNVKGAFTNRMVGVVQTLIKAAGGRFFNLGDWLKAEAILTGEVGLPFVGAIAGGVAGTIFGGIPASFGAAAAGFAVGTGLGVKGLSNKMMDILTNNKTSKDTLIADFFDATQANYSQLSHERYHGTILGKIYGSLNPMFMYERGEYWIHMLNVYSILMHEKVVQYNPDTKERKEVSLYSVLTRSDKVNGNRTLVVKDNVFKLTGEKLTIDDPYFDEVKRRMRYVNQQCHGSMNKEDKGAIHQYMMGKLAMNFRQWMVEHYSRRYRGLHWDESLRDPNMTNFYNKTKVKLDGKRVPLIKALDKVDSGIGDGSFTLQIKAGAETLEGEILTDDIIEELLDKFNEDTGWTRGFYVEGIKTVGVLLKDYRRLLTDTAVVWNNLNESQKESVRELLGELLAWGALAGLQWAFGDPDEHKGEFFYRLWLYILKRTLFDQKASMPLGAITEATTIMQNPFASVRTMQGLLYPITGAISGDWKKTLQSGRYKGWNKYLRNLIKYTMPFYHQVDQLLHIGDEQYAFAVFDNTIR